jgi:hypothetical protein
MEAMQAAAQQAARPAAGTRDRLHNDRNEALAVMAIV